jgi:hypothetical protein
LFRRKKILKIDIQRKIHGNKKNIKEDEKNQRFIHRIELDDWAYTWTQYSTSNGMTGNTGDHINDVFCDTNGNVWAATRYGVFKYSGGSWTQLTKEIDQITSNRKE